MNSSLLSCLYVGEQREPLRIFYESLSKQISTSEMAEFWCGLFSDILLSIRCLFNPLSSSLLSCLYVILWFMILCVSIWFGASSIMLL